MLSERQQRILSLVVDSYLESGRPVGSKTIAERVDVEWGPSTVRAELAELERTGYLDHPHTSAGRIPDRRGLPLLRRFAARVRARVLTAVGPRLDLGQMRREVDEAMRETTAELSRMTDLLALATAPPPATARIHRVEVLLLQPRVVMVVVIASNGAVTKRVFTFEEPLDPGLVDWASSYLNERLAGLGLGARMIRRPARRPRAERGRGRLRGADRRRVHRARGARGGRPLCRGGGPSPLRGPRGRPSARGLADARRSSAAQTCSRSCDRRSRSARCSSGSATRTPRPSCAR